MSEDLDAALSRVDRLGVIVTYAPRLSTSAVWVPEYDLMVLNDQRSDDHLARAIARLITLIDAGPDDD